MIVFIEMMATVYAVITSAAMALFLGLPGARFAYFFIHRLVCSGYMLLMLWACYFFYLPFKNKYRRRWAMRILPQNIRCLQEFTDPARFILELQAEARGIRAKYYTTSALMSMMEKYEAP